MTKILLETGQQVPEFLSHFKPEDGGLDFDAEEELDTSDVAVDAGGADGDANGDVWGSGDTNGAPAAEMVTGDAWGSGNGGAQDTWGTNNDTGAATGAATAAAW